VHRPDGAWFIDGLLAIDEMKHKLEIRSIPYKERVNFYSTDEGVLA
jgi:hypothetical protein